MESNKDRGGTPDQRDHPRTYKRLPAFLKVRTYLQGPAYARDFSPDGICLETLNLFTRIMPDQALKLTGSTARVTFPSLSLSLFGTIARINPLTGVIALTIEHTTDDALWQSVCADAVKGAPR